MMNWLSAIGILLSVIVGGLGACAAIYAIIAAGGIEFLFAAVAVPLIGLPLYALKQWLDERDAYNRYYGRQR